MSRKINWSEPITDEDREWAEQIGDAPAGFGGLTMREAVQANDVKFGKSELAPELDREERIAELRNAIAVSQNEIERLTVEGNLETNPNLAKQGDPKVGLVVDNTGVDGQRPEGSPEPAETYENGTYWTKARLAQEIDSRNGDRKAAGLPELATTGNRSELVERLLQDDRELAESEDED